MKTQKVILPFFYALFHSGFHPKEDANLSILTPQKHLKRQPEEPAASPKENRKK